jgi:Flp pilus assembly protein TadG
MNTRPSPKQTNGQALVEFAFIILILLLLVVGGLDFGRMYFMQVTLNNASEEGAYYLAYNPNDITDCNPTVSATNCDTYLAIKREAISAGVNITTASVNISIINNADSTRTAEVVVTQNVNLKILTFLFSISSLSSTSRMLVLW